jgi:hypothetical protein
MNFIKNWLKDEHDQLIKIHKSVQCYLLNHQYWIYPRYFALQTPHKACMGNLINGTLSTRIL